ncbi:hypothetical protein GEMRC1_005482 [Eukaryota sp. GEM-RC1]
MFYLSQVVLALAFSLIMTSTCLLRQDPDLLSKFDSILPISAATTCIKNILIWVIVFFFMFWISIKILGPSDWTSYEQSTLFFCESDRKHDLIRDHSVWFLIFFPFLILSLIWKVCHFNKNNHSETFSWLILLLRLGGSVHWMVDIESY